MKANTDIVLHVDGIICEIESVLNVRAEGFFAEIRLLRSGLLIHRLLPSYLVRSLTITGVGSRL